MTSPQTKYRTACEDCHRRKIRCDLPKDGGPCQNCSANGLTCLFAPRQKAGRPRLVESAQKRALKRDEASCSSPSAQSEPSSQALSASNTSPSSPSSRLSSQTPMTWNFENTKFTNEMDSLRLMPAQQTAETPGRSDIAYDVAKDSLSGDAVVTAPGAIMSPVPTSDVHRPQFVNMHSLFTFDFILKSCKDLDYICRVLRDTTQQLTNLHSVAANADSACCLIMQATSYVSKSDGASVSLLIASIYKAYEICESLINSIPVGSTDPTQPMDSMLLLKKVDLLLIQASIAATRLGHEEAGRKASQMHFLVESLLHQYVHVFPW